MGENIQLSKNLGFIRIGAALPVLRVADVDFNVEAIINTIRKARNQDVQILTFLWTLVRYQIVRTIVKDEIMKPLRKIMATCAKALRGDENALKKLQVIEALKD